MLDTLKLAKYPPDGNHRRLSGFNAENPPSFALPPDGEKGEQVAVSARSKKHSSQPGCALLLKFIDFCCGDWCRDMPVRRWK